MPWIQSGNIRGPVGPAGAPGQEGPQGPQGPTGSQGPQGAQGPRGETGPQGPQGPKGQDGKSVEIAGQVSTYANLPKTLTQADAGKGYLVNSDGDLYVWSGSAFPPEGQGTDFRGPQGPAGPEGPRGPQGPQGTQGAAGQQGPQGQAGPQGPQGVRGTRWFSGSGTPGTVSGSAPGDYYLDTGTGTVYELS